MFFIGDALATSVYRLPSTMARLEPLTLLAALAVQTRHIGLAATASTTFSDPFNLARSFSSLDHISRGRAAWNVVTSFLAMWRAISVAKICRARRALRGGP